MLRLIACLLFLVCPTYGLATTADDLRDLVRAEDRAGAKEALETAQAEFLAGERNADDIRSLFIALSRSHPQTIGFVEAWADAEPRNPMAQIARAWSLYNASNWVRRGRNSLSKEIAAAMWQEGQERATRAYKTDPRLIPASDAIIRGFSTGQGVPSRLEAVLTVMEDQPNWGSIERAFPLITGQSAFVAKDFCEYVGALGAKRGQDLTHRCLFTVSARFFPDRMGDYVRTHFQDENTPELDYARLSFLIRGIGNNEISEAEMDWAEEKMLTLDPDLFRFLYLRGLAISYENGPGMHNQRFLFTHRFEKAHLGRVESFLEDDPNNLSLLDAAEGVAFGPVDYELQQLGETEFNFVPVYPERTEEENEAFFAARSEQEIDFALRRLLAAPLASNFWFRYARAVFGAGPEYFFDGDLAMQNTIAYEDDPVESLAYMLHMKFQQLEALELTKEHADQATDDWLHLVDTVDVESQILCPFLRAYRVREGICHLRNGSNPNCSNAFPELEDKFDQMAADARAAPACAEINAASVQDLWYKPVSFDQATARGTESN
ncbi:MAG: hypothetical protein AAFY74_12030 [Pseudomonadota bacterium]